MPDDLSGWSYCKTCETIHRQDADGFVCHEERPLPVAMVHAKPGWFRRFWAWLWDRPRR